MPKASSSHAPEVVAPRPGRRTLLRSRALRLVALLLWATLLAAFWLGTSRSGAGPVEVALGAIDEVSRRPWAPLGLLALYLLRPFLLLPVTLLNLSSGLLLGPMRGVAFALAGTLLSATVGYGLGRLVGSAELTARLSARWSLVRMLRSRSFETVVAGGLMYLHADAVNLPSGLLRIPFPTFLAGIAVGNALTLTTAVLAGASVEGRIADATIRVELEYLLTAAALFAVSLGLAYLVRRHLAPRG